MQSKMLSHAVVLCRNGLTALFLCIFSLAAIAQAKPDVEPVKDDIDQSEAYPVKLANRTITLFRVPFLGVAPPERVKRTERAIEDVLDQGGPGDISVQNEPQGSVILIDGALAMILTAGDADPLSKETLETITQKAIAALSKAVAETKEARDHGHLLRGMGWSLLATAILALILWAVWCLRHALVNRLANLIENKAADVPIAGSLLIRNRILAFSRWFTRAVCTLIIAVACYEWLSYVLTRFPYTRAWGEHLNGFVLGIVSHIVGGILRALPDLIVALLIFVIAHYTIKAFKPFFDRAAHGRAALGWLDPDMVRPTQRLVSVGIWLFAVVMAYPYLPGSDSQAFKGVSVLVGLMITLGGSSLIGQAASGLILMYSRTLRVGEYVRIGEQEGTVHELGSFTTKIRTGMGEELTYPNAYVLSTVTKNYSRVGQGKGFVLDTVVTIGYDTPWRQVEAMLIEAAKRTEGVSMEYPPRVFQTALSDFYPEYRVVCYATPSMPLPRAEILNKLHANIQDVFNEYGVQIMSPHYLGDPKMEKLVAKANWFTAPAKPDSEKS